eukprot:1391959-Rhodomonas_salina.2
MLMSETRARSAGARLGSPVCPTRTKPRAEAADARRSSRSAASSRSSAASECRERKLSGGASEYARPPSPATAASMALS